MFVVCVYFEVKSGEEGAFEHLVSQQASNSLRSEPDCTQFDICKDPKAPENFFLYERYTSEQAFQHHLQSDHFVAFDEASKDMIAEKRVQTYFQVET